MSHYRPAPRTTPPARRGLARRRAQIRRRRLTAFAIAAALIAGLVALATGGGQATTSADHHPAAAGSGPQPVHAAPSLLSRENSAIDQLLARQPFITAGGSEKREIALTFDDGPGPYTPALLDQLLRLRVPATFFEIGSMIHYFHASTEREVRAGYVIGDHTELHPMMAELSPAAQQSQILVQTEQLHRYGGMFPRLYRPPYGSYNGDTLAILKRLHMLMVLWTADTEDYTQPGVTSIVHRAVAGARPGAIILMHDAGGTRTETIAALPLIVSALRARGYRLVTVPELVLTDPPQGHQTLPSRPAGD